MFRKVRELVLLTTPAQKVKTERAVDLLLTIRVPEWRRNSALPPPVRAASGVRRHCGVTSCQTA